MNKVAQNLVPVPVSTHLVGFGAKEQQVERDGGDHVDEEPALEVVYGDLARVRDDLVVLVDVGRAEVDEDVDNEHDVDDEVDNRQRVVDVARERVLLPLLHLHDTIHPGLVTIF